MRGICLREGPLINARWVTGRTLHGVWTNAHHVARLARLTPHPLRSPAYYVDGTASGGTIDSNINQIEDLLMQYHVDVAAWGHV